MDQEEKEAARQEKRECMTCEKLINAIPIPKKDRWEFEQWITDNSAPFIQVVVVKWTG